MRQFASAEARNQWTIIADTALHEPVTITRRGRPALVVTSAEDYQALQRLKYAQLKADIQEGLEDLRNGRVTNKTVDDLILAGRQRVTRRSENAQS